jgi:hypothetical protein
MAFVPMTPSLGFPPIDEFVDATGDDHVKPVPLGTIITATDPSLGAAEFIFLKGVASTVVGSWVTYDLDAFQTALIASNAIGPVAVAMSACGADDAGWYQITGKAWTKAADVSDSGAVYIDTAAGICDDAAVAGDLVYNATWASDDDTNGFAYARIARPFVTDEADT